MYKAKTVATPSAAPCPRLTSQGSDNLTPSCDTRTNTHPSPQSLRYPISSAILSLALSSRNHQDKTLAQKNFRHVNANTASDAAQTLAITAIERWQKQQISWQRFCQSAKKTRRSRTMERVSARLQPLLRLPPDQQVARNRDDHHNRLQRHIGHKAAETAGADNSQAPRAADHLLVAGVNERGSVLADLCHLDPVLRMLFDQINTRNR